MECRRLIPVAAAIVWAIVLSVDNVANAQDVSGKFVLSASNHYSPKAGANTPEIGVGYLFSRIGFKLSYARIGLAADRDVNGETVSVFVPTYSVRSLTMIPEVSAGILHGKVISDDETTVKSQLQVGVTLNYTISETMSCGITCKSLFYSEDVIPLIGWTYSVHF